MQISEKSKTTFDACRFCWMCRHICPIGNATGHERNTPRARALSLAMVAREGVPFSQDIIDNLYECALCGACSNDCVTGWDPVQFTKEARLAAALEGKIPAHIETLLANIEEKGNVFGKDSFCSDLLAKINSLPKDADTLFFLGKDAIYKTPDKAIKAIELMEKMGEGFTVLADEPDSGYALDFLFGAADETKKVMEDTAKALNGYKKIVAYDAADAKVFLREYKEWGIALSAEVVTFTSYIAEKIASGAISPKNSGKAYTPQDNALLMRDVDETDKTREILSKCGSLCEMLLTKKDTVFAGNLIMNEYMPSVMKQVAERRWEDAIRMGATTLVTTSAAEYYLLNMYKPENVDILTIEEAVAECL